MTKSTIPSRSNPQYLAAPWLLLAAASLFAVACSGSDASTEPGPGESGGFGAGILPGSGSTGSSAAGSSSNGAPGGAAARSPGGPTNSGGAGRSSAGAQNDGSAGAPSASGRNGSSGGASNSGSSGGASNSGSSSGASNSGSSGNGTKTTTGEPQIPSITGTCPTLATGTATIAGLSGISLQVGAKKPGGSLLFYWHGTGSSAAEVNALFPAAARQEILEAGGIIVSFQGSLGTGGDCSGTGIFSKDDFKVADLITACAIRDQGIDPHRIYTTGCSAGGLQAGCMGALRSNYIAATAPNSGGEVFPLTLQNASHAPAVMTMHGGASDQVIVSFSSTSATYDKQMKGAGSFVVNCNHGGGHCGAPAALQSAAWLFMKDHPFGVAPEPYSSALPSALPSYCMKY